MSEYSIEGINALGQTVSVAHDRIGPGEIRIHTESLSAGEYFFSLTIGDSSYTETILVQ